MELSQIKTQLIDNRGDEKFHVIDPVIWATSYSREHIKKYLGLDFKTLDEWTHYATVLLYQLIKDTHINFEEDREIGGKVLSEWGIKRKQVFIVPPNSLFPTVVIKNDGSVKNGFVECSLCKHAGLPYIHPFDWVRMYPIENKETGKWESRPGECKLWVNPRNDLRVLENFDGQVSGFFETLCINVMKRKYSDIIHPTQKEVLDVYFKNESDPCYICGGHDLVWEKEHFYQRASGFPYYWIDSSGKIHFNILKSCKGCNRGIGGKGSKSPKEYFGEDYNRYCDIYNMPKEPKVTKNGNNRVMVQDMIDDKQYCYDYIETRSDDNKETYLKWFENFIS